jgi:CRISPR/Cas system-associated exonuclease Cas4 (RecB family)
MEIRGQLINTRPAKSSNIFYLSVSKVKTFKDCKLKYKFSYIDRLPSKDWEHTIFGKFLHKVLEDFEKAIIEGYSDSDNELMKACFNSKDNEWRDKLSKDMKIEAHKIMCDYLNNRTSLINLGELPKPISTEKSFNILVDDFLLINGVIDLIQEDFDGVLHVADYKTTKDKRFLKKDLFQLQTYAYVMCLEYPELELIRCSYVLLRHGFEKIKVNYTREEAMSIEKYFIERTEEMKAEQVFRPTPTPLCRYCNYLENCNSGKDFIECLDNKNGKIIAKFGEMDW